MILYQINLILEYLKKKRNKQTMSEKIHKSKGKQPRLLIKVNK